MKRRTVIILVGALVVSGLGASLALIFKPFEGGPRYKALPVSYWRAEVARYEAQFRNGPDCTPLPVRLQIMLGLLNESQKPRVLEGGEGTGPVLVALFKDNDEDISRSAFFALDKITPDNNALRTVAAVIQEGDSERRSNAAMLLGLWRRKAKREIIPVLIELLSSKNADAQLEAIELLGAAIGPDAAPAIPALLGLLNDKEVGTHAAWALRQIDPEAAKKAGVE